jgi:DNA-binding MarR family transcriptional regulator
MSAPRWLTTSEARAWRSWLEVMRLLPNQLEDRLQERNELNLTDYQVLVELSEASDGQLRMTDLAKRTALSKSRLSHQVSRMERSGLIERAECPSDRRGQFAVITKSGWAMIRAAAPGHVDDVRTLFFDVMSPEQVETIGEAMRLVAEKLRESPGTGCANAEAELNAPNPTPNSA